MTLAWWEKFKAEQTSRTLGYGTCGGNIRFHVVRWDWVGPGARSRRTLCGGLQDICMVDTGLDVEDEAACRRFLRGGSKWEHRPTVEQFRAECARRSRWMTPCPRCEQRLPSEPAAVQDGAA